MTPSPEFRDGLVAAIPRLRAFARSLSGNAELADDLVQASLVQAWAGSASFQPGSNMIAWLYTSLRNEYYSEFRKRRHEVGDEDGRRALGAEHLAPACTTHFSIVDRDGNMAAVTQTLLSNFGSKFVTPQSGITMNNGIMWFDPTPGGANALGPGKRCLTNYTPVVAHTADGRRLAIGASGGRRIMPAVMQLLSFAMDYGMDLEAAIHHPRIDASEGAVVIGDVKLAAKTRDVMLTSGVSPAGWNFSALLIRF